MAEEIRLDAAKTVINNYNDTHVDRFNAMVADYNSRCGQFRYRSGSLESAKSEVGRFRAGLEADGRERFVRANAAPSRNTGTASPKPLPDPTVQAIQARLNELGYDAGPADGLMGGRTHTAIVTFQRDRGLPIDGHASASLLGPLKQAQQEKSPVFAPSPKLPTAGGAVSTTRPGAMPANAELDFTGRDWQCKRGYRPVGEQCEALRMPANAELDFTGRDWQCKRGYRPEGGQCEVVRMPANAELDFTGRDWQCKRGYRPVGEQCEAVRVPANAELDFTGRDWQCRRGYRQINNECLAL